MRVDGVASNIRQALPEVPKSRPRKRGSSEASEEEEAIAAAAAAAAGADGWPRRRCVWACRTLRTVPVTVTAEAPRGWVVGCWGWK
jgi:hypothetical protein